MCEPLPLEEVKAYTTVKRALLNGCPCGGEVSIYYNRENSLWMAHCVVGTPNDKTRPGYIAGGELPIAEGSCGKFFFGVNLLHVAENLLRSST